MLYRLTLTTLTATLFLTGCARHDAAPTPQANLTGPTQINVSHIVTRMDDGSTVFVTVDGQDAGQLVSGEDKTLHLPPGKHQVGGYVPTLFGYGRVTIQSVSVTTQGNEVKNIAYTVAGDRPEFTDITQAAG